MPKFDHQLVPRVGRAMMIEGAFPQDEAVIVELEMRSVVEDHVALMRLERLADLADLDTDRLGRMMRQFPEFVERLLVGKPARLQQQLVFAILNLVRWYDRFVELRTVRVRAHLQFFIRAKPPRRERRM